jgi:hypothetical protein
MTSRSDEPHTPTRRERIVVLLEHYVDVEAGWHDGRSSDAVHLPLMCRPWNTPREGYPELDHQLGLMRELLPHLYWHLSETYFRSTQRQVLQCPRCRGVVPTWSDVSFHRHGHSSVAVVPRVVRIVRAGVRTPLVEDAVTWLERNWRGDPFVPDELLPAVA